MTKEQSYKIVQKDVVRLSTSNVKLFQWAIYCGLRLYIYKDHYNEDGTLVPSLRAGSCFEATLGPKIDPFRIPKKYHFPAKFVVCLTIFFKGL